MITEDPAALLIRMRDRFQWDDIDTFLPQRSWVSPKATFHLFSAVPSQKNLLIKLGTNWGSGDARFVHDELNRVGALFSRLGVNVPNALGWCDSPPAVAMDWIESDSFLGSVLTDSEHPSWTSDGRKVDAAAHMFGQALGAFHAAEMDPPDSSEAEARRDFERALRHSGRLRPMGTQEWSHVVRARGFRFSANDFLLAGIDPVVVDPPHVRRYDPIQRDISAYTFETHRQLRRVHGRSADAEELARRLSREFVAGYRQTGPADPLAGRGSWVLGVYETSRVVKMTYNQARSGSLSAARSLRWAMQVRARGGLGLVR